MNTNKFTLIVAGFQTIITVKPFIGEVKEIIKTLTENILLVNPIGWDGRNRSITRNEKYYGAFRKFTADLTFVKDGYKILRELYDISGPNSECYLRVEKFNNKKSEYEIETYMKIDFNTWNETTEHGKGVKVALVDNGFTEKIMSRDDVEIPYDRLETLDGAEIIPFPSRNVTVVGASVPLFTDPDGYRTANILGMEIAVKNVPYTVEPLIYEGEDTRNLIQLDTEAEFPITQSVVSKPLPISTPLDCFVYTKGIANVTVRFNLNFTVRATPNQTIISPTYSYGVYVEKITFDVNNSPVSAVLLKKTEKASSNAFFNEEFTYDELVNLNQNEGIIIHVWSYLVGVATTKSSQFIINDSSTLSIDFSEKYQSTPCRTILPHEAFTRLTESITGEANSFYSEFFGRTDLGYAANGEGAYWALTNGRLLRQFPVGNLNTDENKVAQLTFKFYELFEQFDKLRCMGMSIRTIGGNLKVVIEPRNTFFDSSNVLLTINSIEEKTFSREIDSKLHINEIIAGSEKGEYEEIGGLEEYNNKSYFSTILQTFKNKLDLELTYRVDGFGIELTRRKVYSLTTTEDTKFDENNFIIETLDNGFYLLQKTKEDFQNVIGIDLITTPFNLNLTPARMLLNHGWWINSGLYKFPTAYIQYNKSEVPTKLATKRFDQNFTLTENAPIQNTRLGKALLSGHLVKFNYSPSAADWAILEANQNGLIKIWNALDNEYTYFFLEDISQEPVKNEPNNWVGKEAFPPTIGTRYVLGTDENDFIVTNDNYKIEIL